MVSQAGALALCGLLPGRATRSPASSTPRANEQIYNNATEGTKVIYAGSLAGLVPGGPGHSHQSVRDIALMGSCPALALIEPATERRGARGGALGGARGDRARSTSGSSRCRGSCGFEPEPVKRLEPGRGRVVREGSDGFFVTTGPVMLSQAWLAAERLAADGAEFGVVALPWLRGVDGAWLDEVAGGAPLFTLDNHYLDGGQGDAVLAARRAARAAGREARRRPRARLRDERRGAARAPARRRVARRARAAR